MAVVNARENIEIGQGAPIKYLNTNLLWLFGGLLLILQFGNMAIEPIALNVERCLRIG